MFSEFFQPTRTSSHDALAEFNVPVNDPTRLRTCALYLKDTTPKMTYDTKE